MTTPRRSGPISRALNLQAHTIEHLFHILSEVDLMLIEASLGKVSDKRALANLIDLFTSDEFLALEDLIKASAGAATIASALAPLIDYENLHQPEANHEAKPNRKVTPRDKN